MGHHYMFDAARDCYHQITFTNEETGEEIIMIVPCQGVYEGDPEREITAEEVNALASQANEMLRGFFGSDSEPQDS